MVNLNSSVNQMTISQNGLPTDVFGSVDQIIRNVHEEFPKVVVLTPSTGNPYLLRAIESVIKQDYRNILHLVIVDGPEFKRNTHHITSKFDSEHCKVVTLPFNTGANGMNGHRIYASFPLLINSEFIFFLDEDNWWDTDHVSSLINLLGKDGVDWAYSMRKIYTYNEEYVADDNCESIGPYSPYSFKVKNWPNYIDTNCYAFKRNTIVQTAHHWYHPLRADRYFFGKLLEKFPNYASSKRYTVNYRLKKNGPVSPAYIIEGNQFMIDQYGFKLPWL